MIMWVWLLAPLSGLRMWCSHKLRHRSQMWLGLALLWPWSRLAAAAPIQPLAWEFPHATGVALKRKKAGEGEVFQERKKLIIQKRISKRLFLRASWHALSLPACPLSTYHPSFYIFWVPDPQGARLVLLPTKLTKSGSVPRTLGLNWSGSLPETWSGSLTAEFTGILNFSFRAL